MDPVSDSVAGSTAATSDIQFGCQHCQSVLVVDPAAAGVTVTCQSCGQPTKVPLPDSVVATGTQPNSNPADLERRLKENDSQRTEVTGYINQLSIQLHRWKIRLQTLNERKADLERQLSSLEN